MNYKILKPIGVITNVDGFIWIGGANEAEAVMKQRTQNKDENYITDVLNTLESNSIWDLNIFKVPKDKIDYMEKNKIIKKINNEDN